GGIGSLFVNDAALPETFSPGNMFVPIDDLKPILNDLVAKGRRADPPRPWLGLYSAEANGRIVVTRVSDDSPAKRAGLRPGDVIIGIDGRTVRDLAELYRRAWAQGEAGAEVPLDVVRQGGDEPKIERVVVRSVDRIEWLRVDKGL
ncbi:MAG: PDZ domain-containing protein, partial [Pseudomonadota bacterium]